MKASTDEGLQKENWFYVEFYRKVEEPDIFWLTSLSLYIKKQNHKNRDFWFFFLPIQNWYQLQELFLNKTLFGFKGKSSVLSKLWLILLPETQI